MSSASVPSWNANLLNQYTLNRITPLPLSQFDAVPNFGARALNTINQLVNDDPRQLNTYNALANDSPAIPKHVTNGAIRLNQQTKAIESLNSNPSRIKNINVNQAQVRSADDLNPPPLITQNSLVHENPQYTKPVEPFTIKKTSSESLVIVGVMVAVIIILLFFVVNIYIQTKKMEFMICFLRHQASLERRGSPFNTAAAI